MSSRDPSRIGRRAAITDDEGELPLTPLIDVVFLIVIFFMVNATFALTASIPVDLPEAGATEGAPTGELVITIAADGATYVGARSVAPDQLQRIFTDELAAARDRGVILRGDGAVTYRRLVAVMEMARRAGATNISLVVTPADGQ